MTLKNALIIDRKRRIILKNNKAVINEELSVMQSKKPGISEIIGSSDPTREQAKTATEGVMTGAIKVTKGMQEFANELIKKVDENLMKNNDDIRKQAATVINSVLTSPNSNISKQTVSYDPNMMKAVAEAITAEITTLNKINSLNKAALAPKADVIFDKHEIKRSSP